MATGRPRKEIDKTNFEKLCGLFCTLDEIAGFFDCSEDTIERWCKREYEQSFAEISAKKRGLGKISLRRAGLELAKKNAAVHIFYCKNYLGMTDKQEFVSTIVDDGTREEVEKLVEEAENK